MNLAGKSTIERTGTRRWLIRAAAVFLGIVGSTFAAEIVFRLIGVSYPNFSGPDPILGTFHLAGASGQYTREGDAWVSINSQGLRDKEHAQPKPSGTFRIAVLGDSYTEALQVNAEETFTAVLERELADCSAILGQTVECINFGVSGYGTTQELLLLQHRVWDYDPDLVLLAFLSGNDVADNVRAMKGIEYIPYFVWHDGELVLDDSFLDSPEYRRLLGPKSRAVRTAVRYSRIAQLVNQVRGQIRTAQRQRDRDEETIDSGRDLGTDVFIYRPPEIDLHREAWATTEELIAMMNRDVADHRARFAVVVLSSGIQVTPNTEFRKDFRRKLGVEDLFYPERRIAALGEERGFPVLQLSPKLQSEAVATGVHFHGFDDSLGTGHWNRSGHRRAGELLGEWLCQVMESGENRVIPSVETHEGPFRRGQEERIARQRADP